MFWTLLLVKAVAATSVAPTVPEYVTKHAPLLHLHSADPFRPSDLLRHLRHTTPQVNFVPVPNSENTTWDLDNLASLNQFGGGGYNVSLTSNDDVAAEPVPSWLRGTEPDQSAGGLTRDATPCVVVLVEKTDRDLDAFYFYFYSFNRGQNLSQVHEPIDKMVHLDGKVGTAFGDHVGDWEHNMVRFRDGKPTGIYFSQHRDGAAYSWHDSTVTKRDGRPIVYSAYGSHANYPNIGNTTHDAALIDWCDAGPIWDPILSAYFLRFHPSNSTVSPIHQSPHPPSAGPIPISFFYFTGRWGDQEYPLTDPRQITLPGFDFSRFSTGPTGPRAKHLVRKGLYPDKRRIKTWLEWRIEWIVRLWPCCIRGWRKWVSLVVVVGVVVGVGVGVAVGLRAAWRRVGGYSRTRGYQKVGGVETAGEMEMVERRGD
ncbi:hypothetical protein QBC39DRAFT_105303 [Podospora conica]|nr:hypothetical protein QBC39DRAFT_105303 [Schizothecium conicum]